MPRIGGSYVLPSPPMPLVPGDLARAEDLNSTLTDIATAITGSVAADGSVVFVGPTNFNGQNIGGVATLTASNVNSTNGNFSNISVSSSGTFGGGGNIVHIGGPGFMYPWSTHWIGFGWDGTYGHMYVDGTDQGAFANTVTNDARYLRVTGGTVSGNLTVNGTTSLPGGYIGNLTVSGSMIVGNTLTSGPFLVGANGIQYSGFGGGNHIAFGWNSATTDVYVDGTHVGNIPFTPSDERLKTVLGPYARGLADLLRVRPVRFSFNEAPFDTAREHVGVVAQEIEPLIPEAVQTRDGTKHMANDSVLWALVNAVQELAAEVATLKARLPA